MKNRVNDHNIPWIEDVADLNLRLNNLSFVRPEKVETKEYEGVVYDMEMETENKNYQTSLGIVHNGGGRP